MAQGKRSVNGAQVFEPRIQAFTSVSQFPSIEVGAKETVSYSGMISDPEIVGNDARS